MILFIHGFGSSGHSFKAKLVKEYFEKEGVLSPSLSYVPELAIDTLKEIIELCLKKNERVFLMGSSLGGFYASYLSNLYGLKAVLINPAVNAHVSLKKAIPQAINYYDESYFEFKERYILQLQKYAVTPQNQKNLLLMLQKGDEVLDYKEALDKLPDAHLILEEGGAHHFDGFSDHLQMIADFFDSQIMHDDSVV
jgi:predicted esterase YcpF (UPF0227 family)